MQIDLEPEALAVLRDLVQTTVREMSPEIADTDNPEYRQMLRHRREVLQSIIAALGPAPA
jgi:hypothetical protein